MSKSTVKKVTKKSQGDAIFARELANRANGKFANNRAFRVCVIKCMESEIGVSSSSGSAMYNEAKKATERVSGALGLGRDPKKVVTKPTVVVSAAATVVEDTV